MSPALFYFMLNDALCISENAAFSLMFFSHVTYIVNNKQCVVDFYVWFADPELVSATVVSITQTNMKISWSAGRTDIINDTFVYYREASQTSWRAEQPRLPDSHVISSLLPGHTYKMFVVVHSFDKTATSDVLTNSTGEPFLKVSKRSYDNAPVYLPY